jgi:tetratricopeptide (TPR) repeat protein
LVALLGACASTSKKGAEPVAAAASPDESAQSTEETSRDIEAELRELDVERAQEIVAELQANWPNRADDPLEHPKSLDDVEAILKRDQVTLFQGAIDYLNGVDQTELAPKDLLALYGQIELAWGESYVLLIEIMNGLRAHLETGLEAAPEESKSWMKDTIDDLRLRSEALKLLAVDHITVGTLKAKALIEAHPESYLGHRLLADYFRTVRDWENFDSAVSMVEETNPDSNGLLFLKAAAAFQRDRNLDLATELYDRALAKDPSFVRAQAHKLIIQGSLDGTHRELLALESLNPNHQFVYVAGEAIKRTHAAEASAPERGVN